MTDDGMSYIARRPCGCVVGAIADYRPDDQQWRKTIAKETSMWIREGLTIEHVPDQTVRETLFKTCPQCKPEPDGQLTLF